MALKGTQGATLQEGFMTLQKGFMALKEYSFQVAFVTVQGGV